MVQPQQQQADSAPRPPRRIPPPPPGEEVVISGIAGKFPDSENIDELRDNLFNRVDLTTADSRRWKMDHPEIPPRSGKINGLNKFDASFFSVHFKQAHTMDPMCRMLLERAYEAIVDAGVNPRTLRGQRVGVFVGSCFSESEKTWFYEKLQMSGFGITGCCRAMLANRISYWLGVKGPSYSMDAACSSSLYCLQKAYAAIHAGECDSAIVGGTNLVLHPYITLQFARLGVLSPQGVCRPFCEDANGYTRSEAVVAVFLQKAKDAKRIYSTIVHAGVNCDGYKEQGITYPSGSAQAELMRECYAQCGLDPHSLAYVEAHATGTRVGDPEELAALDEVYCKEVGRTEPLLIGSVKGNIGHTEPASGLCSIAKVIIAMETGVIPPNVNMRQTRSGVAGFNEGRLKVVTDPTPWSGGLVGVNSFGFGGANAHVLLRSLGKEKKNGGAPSDPLPRLVLASGRSEEAVAALLGAAEKQQPPDAEFIRLLHDLHSIHTPGHIYRGYSVVGGASPLPKPPQGCEYYSGERRPVWFVFSGMGSQWPAMGKHLMDIPIFAAAVQKIDAVLAPRGLDIVRILTSEEPGLTNNILNCFVGIATVQVGLVDILRAVGIEPDGIVGHSVGELGCAYADGCLTAEQTVLAAYSRGRASLEATLIPGAMAAVGLGAAAVAPLCPPDVDVACHNGPDSATISGPAELLRAFVKELQAKGVFAKEVACGNIAYHSRYIRPAGDLLLRYLREVIPEPRARSPRWVSSSVPESRWAAAEARLCSAEYQTNNLLGSVLFEEATRKLPSNAVAIEIAPHGLLQAILKRSLPHECLNVPLTRRGANSTFTMLAAVGKLYCAGLQPRPAALYPEVRYPVSRGTPMISPLVRWEHTDDWFVTCYNVREKAKTGERSLLLSTNSEEAELMDGHVIDGRALVPATAYLKLVWETAAMLAGSLYTEMPVVFEDVRFLRATHVPSEESKGIELTIMVHKGTGRFEVSDSGTAVATGLVRVPADPTQEFAELPPPEPEPEQERVELSSRHVYKVLRLRGYNYSGAYRSIAAASPDGLQGRLRWNKNWVSFLDGLLQMKLLAQDSTQLYVPTAIQKITVDARAHVNLLAQLPDDDKEMEVRVLPELDVVACGGMEVRGLIASPIARRRTLGQPVLERHEFLPYAGAAEPLPLAEAARVCVQLALENRPPLARTSVPVRAVELLAPGAQPLAPLLLAALGDLPLVQARATVFLEEGAAAPEESLAGAGLSEAAKMPAERDVVLLARCGAAEQPEALLSAATSLLDGGCLLSREPTALPAAGRAALEAAAEQVGLRLVLQLPLAPAGELLVLRKGGWRVDESNLHVVQVREEESFEWLAQLQAALQDPNPPEKRVLLVAQGQPLSGVLGLFNCLRQEPGPGNQLVRCYFLPGEQPQPAEQLLAREDLRRRLALDLAVNALEGGAWGCYRHLGLGEAGAGLPAEHAYSNVAVPGDLSSLTWFQGPLSADKTDVPATDELVHVYYSALNFRDIMLATGKLNHDILPTRFQQDCVIGFEFSGRTAAGRRVMGLNLGGAVSNLCTVNKLLRWEVPEHWTLAEAATVPVAYSTAIFALIIIGKIKKGESVLVHAGSGGVGQAAIHLSLHLGCRVLATVGTAEKRKFLLDTFPQLKAEDIGCSRDLTFEQLVLRRTAGRGVDLVLNSLAEDKLQASLRCLADRGRFLEIGKVDMVNNSAIGMRLLLRQTSVHGVLLDALLNDQVDSQRELDRHVQALLRAGAVRPIVSRVFERDQVEQAYRYMAAGKHIGKVIIHIRDEEPQRRAVPQPLLLPARPRFFCRPDCCYVVCGGLGGVGLELAHWLVSRGARALVLTSRRGVATGYQARRLLLWRRQGVRALVSTADAASPAGAEHMLREAAQLAPVAAIFNLAVVLKDALLQNQTVENFQESYRCKATATKELDAASRRLCPRLRHFVVFSSVSCGRGNAGQTNYGLANAVMERVVRARHAAGLPATAVQWGAVGDVGLVADMRDDDKQLEIGGTLQQRISSCLEVLDGFLCQPHPVLASMVVAEKRAGAAGEDLVTCVANVLGIRELRTVSPESSLAELGMDSMMAVEIQQSLAREFDVLLTPQDVRGLTFARLRELQSQQKHAVAQGAAKAVAELEQSEGQLAAEEVGGVAELPALPPALATEGLRLLVRAIGDELSSAKPLVALPSLVGSGSLEEESVGTPLLLFPGVEGVAKPLETLARCLAHPVLGLQLGYQQVEPTIEAMTASLMPLVESRVGYSVTSGGYLLVGYSFGGLLALEAAARLEESGRGGGPGTGRVVLLDSAPELMQTMARLVVGRAPGAATDEPPEEQLRRDEAALQVRVILHILRTTSPDLSAERVQEVEAELEALGTWEERMELFGRRAPPSEHSQEHKMAALDAIRRRILAALTFRWAREKPLQAHVTLLRPSVSALPAGLLAEDYGLSKICQRKVAVRYVDGVDHYTLVYSKKTASLLNTVLEQGHADEALSFKQSIMGSEFDSYQGLASLQRR